MKVPDSKGRKALGGTNGSSSNNICSLALLGCDEGTDRYELLGGVGGSLELVNGGDDCVEPGGKRSMNSVILDKLMSFKRSKESPEWSEAAKEVDRSGGGPAGIGNCNKELRSSNEPKLLDELNMISASRPRSGGSGS